MQNQTITFRPHKYMVSTVTVDGGEGPVDLTKLSIPYNTPLSINISNRKNVNQIIASPHHHVQGISFRTNEIEYLNLFQCPEPSGFFQLINYIPFNFPQLNVVPRLIFNNIPNEHAIQQIPIRFDLNLYSFDIFTALAPVLGDVRIRHITINMNAADISDKDKVQQLCALITNPLIESVEIMRKHTYAFELSQMLQQYITGQYPTPSDMFKLRKQLIKYADSQQ